MALVLNILVGALMVILLAFVISVFLGVPFLPTHRRQAELMMDLAGVGPGVKVADLGSGAGRLLWLAAKRGAKAVGYELNPFLYWWTRVLIIIKGYRGQVEARWQSLYQADLAEADVVFTFLMNKPMLKLEAKLFRELKPGARIVSYTFPFPNRAPLLKREGVFVYQVGPQSAPQS